MTGGPGPAPGQALRRIDRHLRWLEPVMVGAGFFLLYVSSQYPGLGGRIHYGDSAEFQLLTAVTGVAHPSGYPLYLLLLKLCAALLPFFTPARVAILFSAACGTAAVVVTFLAASRFSGSRLGGLAASLLLGVSYSFWTLSTEAEVYALYHLLFVLVLYLVIVFAETGSRRVLAVALFVYAISFGTHLLMIFLLPGLAWVIFTTDRKAFTDTKLISFVAASVALGAGLYLYLYYVSNFVPGSPVSTLGRGRSLVETFQWATAQEYGRFLFAFPLREVLTGRCVMSFHFMVEEFSIFGVLFLGFGASWAVARRYRPPLTASLLFVAAAQLVFLLNYDIPDVAALYVAPYIALVILASSVFSEDAGRVVKLLVVLVAVGLSARTGLTERGMARVNNEAMGRIAMAAMGAGGEGPVYVGRPFTNYHTAFVMAYLEATEELGPVRFLRRPPEGALGLFATSEGARELGDGYRYNRRSGTTLAEFAERHRDAVTVWVVQDGEAHRPGPQTSRLFREAGSRLFGGLEGDWTYVAVMQHSAILFEESSREARLVVTGGRDGGLSALFGRVPVRFVSTTFGAMPPSFAGFRQGPRSMIGVGGRDLSPGLRGLNVVALGPGLTPLEARTFDTTTGMDDSSDTVFEAVPRPPGPR